MISKRNDIFENIQRTTEGTLIALDHFMMLNTSLLTTEECVKKIDFHDFTVESFEYLVNQINNYRQSFNEIGPFKKNAKGKWYSCKTNKLQTIETLMKEIEKLKKENEALKGALITK
jgi:hypothetical protein